MMLKLLLSLCVLTPVFPAAAKDLIIGVDANYSLGMETNGAAWKWDATPRDLFQGMKDQGVEWFRVRLWLGDEGQNGKAYATKVVQRAAKAGLNPYLVLFLSDDWADMVKQPMPSAWSNLDVDARAEAVRAYSRDIVTHFRTNGLTGHFYEIGNEIDYGICGVYPGKHAKKNPAKLSNRIWPQSAKIILASQAGVREADPDAKFMLHIAHWWDPEFCIAFFKFMLNAGVQVDYAGLSYFPSSNIGGSLELNQFAGVVKQLNEAIQRPVVIPETAYPSTSDFHGQFARWRKEAPGYPLSPEGQQKWLRDFVSYCDGDPAVAGFFYWSPEWYGEGMWKAFALFDVNGDAKPAWQSFKR